MTHILRGLEWSISLVYIYDLIIFSRTFAEHMQHLEMVFKRLQEENVKLKPTKCHFVKEKIEYLGHLVSAKSNPHKVRVVQEFPRPKCTTDFRSFLGTATYYHRFFSNLAQIIKIITWHLYMRIFMKCTMHITLT